MGKGFESVTKVGENPCGSFTGCNEIKSTWRCGVDSFEPLYRVAILKYLRSGSRMIEQEQDLGAGLH